MFIAQTMKNTNTLERLTSFQFPHPQLKLINIKSKNKPKQIKPQETTTTI